MYYNVFGEKVSRKRFKQMCAAAKNRRELIAAGLTKRRDLFRMGLLTAGGGDPRLEDEGALRTLLEGLLKESTD